MPEYYNWQEKRWHDEYIAQQNARATLLAEKAAISKPGIAATIDAWEHGDLG
jgi:hypothetical protein